ncbi:hypothetical protein CPB84DRAFT_1763754 [Gymnopilus junonius]|uniref:Protein kinase domain-containing protein n=1 Tax=Gymnopilus junonius TaxID=109634 RepID=A0A9P5NZT2_GYMJU|nr:hypothetical protein CPB84DRAFT_1763754 [Gymnopilus junonius]
MNPPVLENAHVDVSLPPPEANLGIAIDTKADIWILGCAASELLTGIALGPSDIAEDEHERLMTALISCGKVPGADIPSTVDFISACLCFVLQIVPSADESLEYSSLNSAFLSPFQIDRLELLK